MIAFLSVASFLGFAAVARAAEGDPDLSAVTTAIGTLKTVMLTAAGLVVVAGLGLFALKYGGVWVKKIFQRFAS